MSSGRFTSALFSCSFFSIDSSVLSTGGFGAFSCWDFLSSCEPKLLGSVLLRWRVTGGRSSSDFISFCSGENSLSYGWFESMARAEGSWDSPFSSLRSRASSLTHRSTSGFPTLSLWDGCKERKMRHESDCCTSHSTFKESGSFVIIVSDYLPCIYGPPQTYPQTAGSSSLVCEFSL